VPAVLESCDQVLQHLADCCCRSVLTISCHDIRQDCHHLGKDLNQFSKMKTSLWGSLVAGLRKLLAKLWGGQERHVLLPSTVPELLTVLGQARDNGTTINVVGGAFPASGDPASVTVSLLSMDRLLGLDSGQKTVTVEPGMRLSTLTSLLATVHLCLDISGRVPDLTVMDALAVLCPSSSPPSAFAASVLRVEVVTPCGEVVQWSWNSHPRQMAAIVCGLGATAIITSVTFLCINLTRVNEVSYLTSVRELLDTWSLVSRSSSSQQLTWFPFTELVVITHTSELDRLSWASSQPLLSQVLGKASEKVAAIIRRINLAFFSSLPLLSSLLARVQFISLWTAARHRSDHTHHPLHLSSCAALQGSYWILPINALPTLLHSISSWAANNPSPVTSPIYVQTIPGEKVEGGRRTRTSSVSSTSSRDGGAPQGHRGFLQPRLRDQAPSKSQACVWYDWFLSDSDPDPTVVAHFEELFLEAGGVRCWSAERLVSPLLLASCFPEYREWCQVKSEVDPDGLLGSGYVQGTLTLDKK